MKKGDENRNFDSSGDLDNVIDDWLGAREQWLGGCDPEKLERLTTATENLYATFAQDWHGDQRTLSIVLERFCEALVTDGDWSYRHLEVRPVYPHRAR